MYADLHIHTCYSDGTQTPAEVAENAYKKGVGLVSVCDHNALGAYPELKPACETLGLKLILGVELDTYYNEERLHLLAYNFDPSNGDMLSLIHKSRAQLDQISVEMIICMEKAGYSVSLADYEAYERPKLTGGWKGLNYLFDKGISESLKGGMKYHKLYNRFRPDFYDIKDACRIVNSAGGVPVLAHPGVYWLDTPQDMPHRLKELKERGVCGVECYYPWHSEGFTRICTDFCRKNDMRITTGGDGHGSFEHFVEGVEYDIGIMKVDTGWLDLKGLV